MMSSPLASSPSAVPRAVVLERARALLAHHHRLLLRGPAGVGKTVLLNQLLPENARVLRAYPSVGGAPFGTLAELFADVDLNGLSDMAMPRREAIGVLLRTGHGILDTTALLLALRELLTSMTRDDPVYLVVDAAENCDGDSVALLAQLLRHLPSRSLRILCASRDADLAHRLGLTAEQELPVPYWSLGEVTELLSPLGLRGRLVSGVHRASGGLPGLAVRIARSVREGAVDVSDRASADLIAGEQLAGLTASARLTLLMASLAIAPSEDLLLRAGRGSAREDLTAAARLGLIEFDATGTITFPAAVTVKALSAKVSADATARMHRKLAAACNDTVAATRHLALADTTLDAETARHLDTAVDLASGRGDLVLAAELAMLAADRTPAADGAAMVKRLVTATQLAGSVGRVGLVEPAARVVSRRATDPDDRMLARMAAINAAGQNFDGAQWAFAEAALETETDPQLRAELLGWQSWRAYIRDGDVAAALEFADQAHRVASGTSNRRIRMQTLTMMARMQRSLGEVAAASDSLARALRIAPAPGEEIGASAQFALARHQLFDDRLDEARDGFAALLSVARRQGEVKGHLEVLRSLAEVEARRGDCRGARDYRDQALDLLVDGELSPGPIWYTAAMVDVAVGDFDAAVASARRGLRSAREERDTVFTARNLYALGVARSRAGEPAAAVAPLREAGEVECGMGTVDPSILPWQAELAEALAAIGEVEAATAELAQVRDLTMRLGVLNLVPRLDLAEAVCLIGRGDLSGAETVLLAARDGFDRLGLRIEAGRTMVGLARVERRRRRRRAAETMLMSARRLFADCAADGWSETVTAELERLSGARTGSGAAALTVAEARLVELVADGASNQQAATALGISVKTVEATLTRVYRKLGVRARVQLTRFRSAAS